MDLFQENEPAGPILPPPLAERLRPTDLSGFFGQQNLVGDGKLLHRALAQKSLFSMILWGPPGSGKTTLARIVAHQTQARFYPLSAVAAGVKEVREVIERARQNRHDGHRTLLFIDEIHRFNKAQQDALLQAVEEGALILIGATTENPSFEVIAPLLSRCRVLTLAALQPAELEQILNRALQSDADLRHYQVELEPDARQLLIQFANGDARKLLNTLELAVQIHGITIDAPLRIGVDHIREALQRRDQRYDKHGDYHYDVISAFIKSVRGSDPDAAVFWLAVMLDGGEDPLFIARRLVILASEDIGNADPHGLPLAMAGYQATHAVGLPEAAIILAQVTTFLAAAQKSNASCQALNEARSALAQSPAPEVPLALRNAPTSLMKALHYGHDYHYAHDYPEHFIHTDYFPATPTARAFYRPGNRGYEHYIRRRLLELWPERYPADDQPPAADAHESSNQHNC